MPLVLHDYLFYLPVEYWALFDGMIIGLYDLTTGKMRVLLNKANRDWQPGGGVFSSRPSAAPPPWLRRPGRKERGALPLRYATTGWTSPPAARSPFRWQTS
ncbi:MAG: hypothetical protein ACM3X6_09610 [Patescibacteria group bacterium]